MVTLRLGYLSCAAAGAAGVTADSASAVAASAAKRFNAISSSSVLIFLALYQRPSPAILLGHGRACPGHPRLCLLRHEDVDARHEAGHDEFRKPAVAGADYFAGMTGNST